MNGLELLDALQPERECLDDATAARVWNRIVASRSDLAEPADLRQVGSEEVLPGQRTPMAGRSRRVALVGAAAAVVIGMVAVASVTSRDRDPAPAPATQPGDPTNTGTSVTRRSTAVTTADVVAEPLPPTESSPPLPPDASPRPVAVIDPDVARAAPARRSHLDEWVEYPSTGPTRYAIRATDLPSFEAVSWDVEPDNEWDKSDRNLPQVDLVASVDTRRGEVFDGRVIRYVFSRGDSDRLAVTVPAASESELLAWLRDVATAPDVNSVEAPAGFDVLPSANDPYTVYYPNITSPDAIVTTFNFDDEVDPEAWIAATQPAATIEPVDPSAGLNGDAWTVTGPDPSMSRVVWRPSPEIIVELTTTQPGQLARYAAGLALLDDATESNAVEYQWLSSEPQPLPSEFDVVIQGDTSIGRFYYYAYTTNDGQTCHASYGAELGGSAGCNSGAVPGRPVTAICESGSGWDFTGRTLTWALVDADQVDYVEIREHPDDSQPVAAQIETGDFETQPWALIWASFDHPEPVESSQAPVTFTGGNCAQQ